MPIEPELTRVTYSIVLAFIFVEAIEFRQYSFGAAMSSMCPCCSNDEQVKQSLLIQVGAEDAGFVCEKHTAYQRGTRMRN
jgi:hypothetical protein